MEMRRAGKVSRRPSRASAAAAAGLDLQQGELLDRLKAWRLEQARSQGVPPYVIFHDATLTEIARRAPRSRAALAEISGIGARKLDRYGDDLLELLS